MDSPVTGGPAASDPLPAPPPPPAPLPPPELPPLIAHTGMDAGRRQVDFPAPQDIADLPPRLNGLSAMPGWQPRRRPGVARVVGPLMGVLVLLVFGLVATRMAGFWGSAVHQGADQQGTDPVVVLPDGTRTTVSDPNAQDPAQDGVGSEDNSGADNSVSGITVGDLAYQPRALTCGRRALALLPQQHARPAGGRQWCVLDVTVQPASAGSSMQGPDPSDATLQDAHAHHWTTDSDTTLADDHQNIFTTTLTQPVTLHYWFMVDAAAHPTAVTFAHEGDVSDAVALS